MALLITGTTFVIDLGIHPDPRSRPMTTSPITAHVIHSDAEAIIVAHNLAARFAMEANDGPVATRVCA